MVIIAFSLIALTLTTWAFGPAGMQPAPAHAEVIKDPPKTKDPAPVDHCKGDKMKSSCKNAEATRSLLRTAPKPPRRARKSTRRN